MDIHPSGVSAPIGINKSEKTSLGVAGHCYIGEEDGYRTCIKVGPRDTCYSGDIYPSRDKCINPNLR